MKAGLAPVSRCLTRLKLFATAVLIAAVLACGRDWPDRVREVWQALGGS